MEFRRYFWLQKTRVPGLSYGIVYVMLYLAVLVQCRLVTDRLTNGWTDGRTRDDDRICRDSVASLTRCLEVTDSQSSAWSVIGHAGFPFVSTRVNNILAVA